MDIDPVDVSAKLIAFDQIVCASAEESEAEIVAKGRSRRGLGGRCTVAIEDIQPNSVVVAVDESSSAATCPV